MVEILVVTEALPVLGSTDAILILQLLDGRAGMFGRRQMGKWE